MHMKEEEGGEADHGGWPLGIRRLGGLLLVLSVLGLVWLFWDVEAFLEWQQQAHPLAFFAAMVVLPAVGFPVTPFYLLAGATFGTVTGLVGTWAAISLNLLLCHWIASKGPRRTLRRWLVRAGVRLPEMSEKSEVRFALLVRLAPAFPAFAKNYLLVLAGISFRTYFLISLLVTGTYATCFVLLGESFQEQNPWKIGGLVFLLLAIVGGFSAWRRWKGGGERIGE